MINRIAKVQHSQMVKLWIRKQEPLLFIILILLFSITSLAGCGMKPPAEDKTFNKSDLVEINRVDSSIRLDIRYATKNNFTGRVLYKEARAFLQRPAAEALARAHNEIKPYGYGFMVFDSYRPWSTTKTLWNLTERDKKKFVADPRKGSRHNRGCAVDLTLYDLASGEVVEMTSEYDEMTERSYPDFSGGTAVQRERRDLLRSIMEKNGFKVYPYEWWHFDFDGWESFKIENISFSEVEEKRNGGS
jgi:D-alanyl-D-alanine dipeptidase